MRTGRGDGEYVLVKTGSRQGCVMLARLLNIVTDGVAREVQTRIMNQGTSMKGKKEGKSLIVPG